MNCPICNEPVPENETVTFCEFCGWELLPEQDRWAEELPTLAVSFSAAWAVAAA
jgi:endogenous inhibitor of DNA gyrase (YacG/DUF329 family)